ncbi:hypothetical protein [Aurantimonas sp. 22II-16-19i]|uniref:hypothetical protein n=1 Tax=Aurantimonas sp. 22II-16-19i TaxID=1317114 RepID=UPI0009F7D19B|nr:hypothetical protein [Aurantimonas sp. 22II-16-19i]ORE95077.1 hypothetical protein ATO4_12126 [Aurantimonas sp. 22II-16-19i]
MTSYLIDLLLVVALVVTALRCGRMHKELRALRQADLAVALTDAEVSLNRAAEAIVGARYEGVEAVRALERQLAEARSVADDLSALVTRADFHVRRAVPDAAADPYRDIFAAAHDRLHASLAR